MPAQGDAPVEQKDLSWDDVMPGGHHRPGGGLSADSSGGQEPGGELLNPGIKGCKKLSQELGFLVPAVPHS